MTCKHQQAKERMKLAKKLGLPTALINSALEPKTAVD